MQSRLKPVVTLVLLLAMLAWADTLAACVPVKGPPSAEQAEPACKPAPPARRARRAVLQDIAPMPRRDPPGINYGYRPSPSPLPEPGLAPRPAPLNCGAAGCVDPGGVPYQNPTGNVLLDSKGHTCVAQNGWVQCF